MFYQKSVPVKLTNEYGRGAVLLFMKRNRYPDRKFLLRIQSVAEIYLVNTKRKMVRKYWFVLYRICYDEHDAWEG